MQSAGLHLRASNLLDPSVIDHGDLLGLGDDDHPQYLLDGLGRAIPQSLIGGLAAGDILDVTGASSAPDVGIVRVNSPVTLAYDTFSNTTPAQQFMMTWAPTFTATSAYIGGCLSVAPVVTISTGTFIPATFSDTSSMLQAATPGFSAFTFINELAVIRNSGNFNLMSALVINVGLTHERNSSGTSTTPGATGFAFSPQTRATVSGAVMTKTDQTALRCSPTFSTVGGSTANLGTIRGAHVFNPAVALFQPGSGAESAVALIGLDVNALSFGGTIVKAAVRSAIAPATNARFLLNNGNAVSDFGTGHIYFDDNAGIVYGQVGVGPYDVWQSWNPAGYFRTFFLGNSNSLRLSNPATDRYLYDNDGGSVTGEYNFNCSRFSLGAQTGNNGNVVGGFVTPARTIGVGGDWSDFLLTQGGSLTVGGLAMGRVSAWVVNGISYASSSGTIGNADTFTVGGMVTSSPGVTITERQSLHVIAGRSRFQSAMQYDPINPSALASGNNNNWAGLLTGSANNGMRHWARVSGNATTSVLTGIDATAAQDGDTFQLTNVSANAIEITDEDTASTAANRIITATNDTYTLQEDETITIRYDLASSRWRVIDKQAPPLKSLHLSGDQFRKGATAPTDVTVGVTPTIPALLFDATNELASLYHSFPDDLDRNHDVVLRLQFSLSSAEVNLDTCDFTCDYTAPTLATGGGIAKASTQVTGQFTAVTGRLAVGDIYVMDITFPFADATNPIASAVGIAFEIHMTNVTGVADIHLIDGDFIYTSVRA